MRGGTAARTMNYRTFVLLGREVVASPPALPAAR